jgi:HJR/Mrr/RecB family endonuclease
MSPRRKQSDTDARVSGYIVLILVVVFELFVLYTTSPIIFIIVTVVTAILAVLAIRRKQQEKQEQEERARQEAEEREEVARKRHEQLEEERRREEQERAEQIEALLERDAFRESVHYMSGVEFENFMANVFDKKGYHVQTTPINDQGVDLLLTIDDRKVAVQLKRYTAPVGNKAVQEVVAGMFHYKAKEAWVITTGSFTKGAVELAKSNRVRLIDGRQLEDWLDDLRDEA